MTSWFALVGVIVAAAGATPRHVGIAAVASSKADSSLADYCTERLAQRLSERGLKVTSPDQMLAMLSLAQQKQMLGCSEASCAAELAAALGVDAVVQSRLTRLGAKLELTTLVLKAEDGDRLAQASATAGSDGELPAAVDEVAKALLGTLAAGQEQGVEAPPPTSSSAGASPGAAGWVTLSVGLAAGVAGGVLVGVGLVRRGSVLGANGPLLTESAARASLEQAQLLRTVGWIAGGVGLAVALAGVVVLALPSPSQPARVELTFLPGGLGLKGVWP